MEIVYAENWKSFPWKLAFVQIYLEWNEKIGGGAKPISPLFHKIDTNIKNFLRESQIFRHPPPLSIGRHMWMIPCEDLFGNYSTFLVISQTFCDL